ncbi:unnamed protein product [Rhizophagus irregularis]|nr:unnamed protein product [Rhizophagus irregularis]
MVGIPHPYFDWEDSIPDFLAQLKLDLQNQEIDPNDNVAGPPTGRDNAIGHLRAWQANLVAVNGRTAVQIEANALNKAVGQPGNAIVNYPTNAPVNVPNANAENTVVVAGIRFGQAVWWLKTHFHTVEEELWDLIRTNYRPEKLRRKFLDALPLLWLEKAEDIVQVPAPQTVEPIRQPRGPPSSLKTEEGLKNYYVSEYLKEIGLLSKEDLDSDYPVKPFQRPRPQQNNNSARFDRIEEGLEETQNNVNQLADLFQKKAFIQKCGICGETDYSKVSCPKRPIAQSKFTRLYFTPLTPIVPPDSDDSASEFGGINDPAIKALG